MYYNQDPAIPITPSTAYDPQCSNHPSNSFTCKGPSPDLNLLIVPLFGWVYRYTGDPIYRTRGDLIFNTGVTDGCAGCDGKHFSQAYRWAARYINWRQAALVCDINGDDTVNVLDVQRSILQALGSAYCTGDMNGDGKCDVLDTQRIINASLGAACRLGP